MKVYIYVKHKIHPQLDSNGMQEGDIAFIFPINADQGNLTLRAYLPIVMDLNIPCSQGQVSEMDFTVTTQANWKCAQCPFNDPDSCDVIKYTRGEFSAGDILNPPRVIKSRKYKIDRSAFISPESDALIINQNKTEAEKQTVFINANKLSNEQPKTICVDKIKIVEVIK